MLNELLLGICSQVLVHHTENTHINVFYPTTLGQFGWYYWSICLFLMFLMHIYIL